MAAAACGSSGGQDPQRLYARADIVRCLDDERENLVELRGAAGSTRREVAISAVPRQTFDDADAWTVFGAFDVTFGEMVGNTIVSPPPTVVLFFRSTAEAGRHAPGASIARGNVLVFFARPPTDRQRARVEGCFSPP